MEGCRLEHFVRTKSLAVFWFFRRLGQLLGIAMERALDAWCGVCPDRGCPMKKQRNERG